MKDWKNEEDLNYVWKTLRLVCRGFRTEVENRFGEEVIKLTTVEMEFGGNQHASGIPID